MVGAESEIPWNLQEFILYIGCLLSWQLRSTTSESERAKLEHWERHGLWALVQMACVERDLLELCCATATCTGGWVGWHSTGESNTSFKEKWASFQFAWLSWHSGAQNLLRMRPEERRRQLWLTKHLLSTTVYLEHIIQLQELFNRLHWLVRQFSMICPWTKNLDTIKWLELRQQHNNQGSISL